ncbi:CaiB/BaiF CoA transferase family protein [Oceaniglobus roseus]|uniref:CaiB/BaiF CoA transferase family protein n=1 Tax=Oceaniglobus roseus TaxID=1737570 RepID=UPI000C7F0D16|nr:CaiB/BaiF CoA-transferase family protein [Kandeliimicrobium roseum]
MSGRPLEGLLVVALEQAVAAPVCTLRLADAGARVIKVERAAGETARHYDSAVHGTSAYFAWLNRGKESAVLDLKAEADLGLLKRMAARADVLVHNLAPGAMGRLGLGRAALAALNPRLIGVEITGYGQDTDYARMRAYDMLVQAESGICSVTGTPEVPSKVGVSVTDIATGMNAHAAVLEALIARGITGRGQHLEIAMFDSMADWMSVPLLHLEQAGQETGRFGLSHASISPSRPYTCGDGGTVIVGVQTPEEWHRFCAGVLWQPDLATDPRFATNAVRVRHRADLDALSEPVFAAMTAAEAAERLEAARIAWGRLNDAAGLSAHPALRRMAVRLPGGAEIALPRPAGRPAPEVPPEVPALGAHTEAIRAEFGT